MERNEFITTMGVEAGQVPPAPSGVTTHTVPQDAGPPPVAVVTEGRSGLRAPPPPLPFPAAQPGGVSPILTGDPNAPADAVYKDSLERIARLGASLDRGQVAELYRFLALREYPGLDGVSLNAVKNQVMDKLLRQQTTPEGLGATLAALALGTGNDELLRDFCLQHFEPYLKVLSDRGQLEGHAEAAAVHEAYQRMLGERQSPLAGVALLGMERASAFDPAIDRAQVLRAAASYASDASCDLRTRVSATQVCGVMGDASALPAVRALAAAPGQPLTLRLAAIHALGSLGNGEADIRVLREAAQGPDPYAAKAASLALKRLGE